MNFLRGLSIAGDHVRHQIDLNGDPIVNFRKVAFAGHDLAGQIVRGCDGGVEERGHAAKAACVHGVEVQASALHAADGGFNRLPR